MHSKILHPLSIQAFEMISKTKVIFTLDSLLPVVALLIVAVSMVPDGENEENESFL